MTSIDRAPEPALPATGVRDLAPVTNGVVAYNVAYLAGVWVSVAVVAWAVARWPSWWTVALGALVVSGRQHALLNVEHEAIHNMFLRRGRGNDVVGRWLAAAPCGSPFQRSKSAHLLHHRLLAKDGDPDLELHGGDDKATRAGLRRHLLWNLLGGYALRVLGDRGSGARPPLVDLVAIAVAQAVLFGACALLLEWWVYVAVWAAPLASLTAFWHIVRSYSEHALTPAEAGPHGNRLITIRSNPVELAFLAPYNMNFHAEHHLYPFVPAVRLPKVRAIVLADAAAPPVLVRRSYAGTVLGHVKALP